MSHVPLLKEHSSSSPKTTPPPPLIEMPAVLFSHVRSFLTAEESWVLIGQVSCEILKRFGEELGKGWENAPLRAIYTPLLPGGNGVNKWITLKKLLCRDLNVAYFTLEDSKQIKGIPHFLPLSRKFSLFQAAFPELQQIAYIAFRANFARARECAFSLRTGAVVNKEDFFIYPALSCCCVGISLSFLRCCLPIPVEAVVAPIAGGCCAPFCRYALCHVDQKPFLQTIERLREIRKEVRKSEREAIQSFSDLEKMFFQEQIDRKKVYDQLAKWIEEVEIIFEPRTSQYPFLSGIESLKRELKKLSSISNLSITMQDLWFLNKMRLVALCAFPHISPYAPREEEETLRKAVAANDIIEAERLMIQHRINVAHISFPAQFFHLFVQAGGDLAIFLFIIPPPPHDPFPPPAIYSLLKEGIFADDPHLLDRVAKRPCHAFTLFFHGLDSPKIDLSLQLRFPRYYENFKRIRKQIKEELGIDWEKHRSTLFVRSLSRVFGRQFDNHIEALEPIWQWLNQL